MAENISSKDSGLASSFKRRTKRIINKDGSFNVKRTGSKRYVFDIYQHIIRVKWSLFFFYVIFFYFLINLSFALLYSSLGNDALSSFGDGGFFERIPDAFYFSVQTFTSVGYGGIIPVSGLANFISSIEALFGLVGFAIITGTVYGRFSKPVAKLEFSNHAVINRTGVNNEFQFKLVNRRQTHMMNVECTVIYSSLVNRDGVRTKDYVVLNLRLAKILFFPLSWTVVHEIDESSPLYGKTEQGIAEEHGEFLVHVKGLDETYGSEVNKRLSYLFNEVKWGYSFIRSFETDDDGIINLDLDQISTVVKN